MNDSQLRKEYIEHLTIDLNYVNYKGEVHLVELVPALASTLITEFERAEYKNRGISNSKVEQYARDIGTESWNQHASTIHVDLNGVPINGLHRLYACVLADKPLPTVLVFSPTREETNRTVDTGRPRSGADLLQMETGLKQYHAATSAALRMYIRHISAADKGSWLNQRITVTPADVVRAAEAKADRIFWLHENMPHNTPHVCSPSRYFFMGLVVKEEDLGSFNDWWFSVVNGYTKDTEMGLPHHSSAFHLREKLQAARYAKSSGTRRPDRLDVKQTQFLCIKAWIKKGEMVTRLSLPRGTGKEGKSRDVMQAFGIPKEF